MDNAGDDGSTSEPSYLLALYIAVPIVASTLLGGAAAYFLMKAKVNPRGSASKVHPEEFTNGPLSGKGL